MNNLAASMLWHCFTVVEPPDTLVEAIQKKMVDFLWGGFHWTRTAVMYLPLVEGGGGQGPFDLSSHIITCRLQTVQRFLYHQSQPWTEVASVLLRQVENVNYDKHLFLLNLIGLNTSNTSVFYQSVLRVWTTTLRTRRESSGIYRNFEEEPLLHSPLIKTRMLNSASMI